MYIFVFEITQFATPGDIRAIAGIPSFIERKLANGVPKSKKERVFLSEKQWGG